MAAEALLQSLHFWRRKPQPKSEVDRLQDEQIKARWTELLARPAHEYLQMLAESGGVQLDIASLRGKACSFWLKKHDEDHGKPCIEFIERITREGNCLAVYVSCAPPGKMGVVYLYNDACGAYVFLPQTYTRGVADSVPIMQFQFL